MTDLTTTHPGIDALEDMTEEEGKRLIELEREVEKAMRAAGRIAGEALAEIRDRRLYRASHTSFEAYCIDRLDLSRSTAYRMIATARGDTNGLAPEVRAIGEASARAAARRHTTLDQPPETIDPRPEPLQEAPERSEEAEEERTAPKMPEGRLTPPSPFQQSETPASGKQDGRPPVPGGERDLKIKGREGLNKVMAALDSALNITTEAGMAAVATPNERLRLGKLGAAITVEDRKAMRPEGVVDPKDCDHPVGRMMGEKRDICGKCGARRKSR